MLLPFLLAKLAEVRTTPQTAASSQSVVTAGMSVVKLRMRRWQAITKYASDRRLSSKCMKSPRLRRAAPSGAAELVHLFGHGVGGRPGERTKVGRKIVELKS
jgi:hypothetical protein